jgi:hypothetical protein
MPARPNAVPASQGRDYQNDTSPEQRNKDGSFRDKRSTKDYCDFCQSVVWIKKRLLPMRTKGFKLACEVCSKKNGFKFGDENRVVLCNLVGTKAKSPS